MTTLSTWRYHCLTCDVIIPLDDTHEHTMSEAHEASLRAYIVRDWRMTRKIDHAALSNALEVFVPTPLSPLTDFVEDLLIIATIAAMGGFLWWLSQGAP